MKIGMLWLINKNETMFDSLYRAIDYYKSKYEHAPTLCQVNPKDYEGMVFDVQHTEQFPIDVEPDKYILPFHLWIGVKDLANSNVGEM